MDDCFGTVLVKTSKMWEISDQSKVIHYIKEISKAVLVVLRRQYKTYLELSEEDIEKMHTTTGKNLYEGTFINENCSVY